jgi:hypothetical protein
MTPATSLHSAARGYVERLGLWVFPVAADGRTPIKVEGRFENGCHDATNDPAEADWRWTRFPRANVALACGIRSGVFALDIDAKDGKTNGFESLARLEALHGPLPRSWRSLTPSSGEHRFFRQPEGVVLRNKVGLRTYDSRGVVQDKYLGLDIRTEGGSVALPPSRKPNGAYRWAEHPLEVPLADAPAWLLKLGMDPPPPPRADRRPLRRDAAARVARYVEKALDAECATVAGTKSGRNDQLFRSSANLGQLVGANLLPQDMVEGELYRAADACGLVREDGAHSVRATILSGIRRGVLSPREVATT